MLVNPSDKKYFKKKRSIVFNGELVTFDRPMIMGILNTTPDSFFDGGKYNTPHSAIIRVRQMIAEGADIIDVGAYSTRPGAPTVSKEEELERLLPVVGEIKKEFPEIILSIDTFRSEVAAKVIEKNGCCIINDISGGSMDKAMFETVAHLHVPYIVMHIQGTPETMQLNPVYKNVTKDVIRDLSEKVYRLHELGVSDVIIDPGFGFGKTLEHNYELFNHLDAFRFFELPVLVGISRKSMIYKLLNSSPGESLNGTSILNSMALLAGADIIRVHDVKEAAETVAIFEKLKQYAQ
jgi:dihydropteroate synthase